MRACAPKNGQGMSGRGAGVGLRLVAEDEDSIAVPRERGEESEALVDEPRKTMGRLGVGDPSINIY